MSIDAGDDAAPADAAPADTVPADTVPGGAVSDDAVSGDVVPTAAQMRAWFGAEPRGRERLDGDDWSMPYRSDNDPASGAGGGDEAPGGWDDSESWDGWDGWDEGAAGERPPDPEWVWQADAQVQRERLAQAATGRPGGGAAAVLERLCPDGREGRDLAGLDAAGLLDGVAGLQRLINWAQATQQRYTAALARPGVAAPVEDAVELASCPLGIATDIPGGPIGSLLVDDRWGPAIRDAAAKLAAAEVGCRLGVAPTTARSRTERAVTMVDDLPDTLAAQQAGDLDGFRASIIAERTAVLGRAGRRRAEQRILPTAGERTPGRLRDLTDREVTRIDPDAAARRERQARRGRGVRADTGRDGMGTVRADVSATDAQMSYAVLDRIARRLQSAGLAGGRGRSQIRADVFTDIFTHLSATGQVHIDQPGQPDTSSGNDTGTDTTGTASTGSSGAAGQSANDDASRINTGAGTGDARATASAADNGIDGDGQYDAPVIEELTDDDHTDDSAAADTAAAAAAVWQAAADRAASPATTTGPAGSGWVLPVCVNVYVHASTLAGWDSEPAELAGHGIISAEFARALADSAGTIRALITRTVPADTGEPPDGSPPDGSPPSAEFTVHGHSSNPARSRVCGTVLDAGRSVYRPSRRTADYITSRDRICSFTGCRARAEACDLDHRQPWDSGGATCPCNMEPLYGMIARSAGFIMA